MLKRRGHHNDANEEKRRERELPASTYENQPMPKGDQEIKLRENLLSFFLLIANKKKETK